MFGQGEPFTHWSNRLVGDEPTKRAATGLLRRLFTAGDLQEYRACLYRPGGFPGIRQALFIDLGRPTGKDTAQARLRGLWLVEEMNRKVFLYGRDRLPATPGIGGTVLHDIPVLNPDSAWYRRLAETAAARVLRLATAAIRDESSAANRDFVLLAQVEHSILRSALSAFAEGLDAEALAALGAEGGASPETYNHYWNPDGTLNRNRIQAARSFPFFGEPIRVDWRLRRSVERGDPLARELATHYQVHPRTIQQTRTLVPARVPARERAVLLKRLDQLPAEYLPKSGADWGTFLDLSEPLSDLAAVLNVDFPRLAAPLAKGWHQGLSRLSSKHGTAFDVTAIYEMMRASYRFGAYPMLQAEMAAAGLTGTLSEDPPAAFFPLWFGRYALPRLAEMAGRWREAYRQFSLKRLGFEDAALGAKLSWTGLLDTDLGHGQGPYRILELTSRQALELEGREQRHCVASYAVKCLLGESAIFSIRDRRNGKALSTFEVGLTDDTPALLQHHGYENATPSAQLQAVAERFVQHVLRSVPAARIAAVRKVRRAVGATVHGLLAAPNTHEEPLSDEERAVLADKVAFAHPAEAKRDGLLRFIERNGQADAILH
ncbi:PcfJ domain-containing protein [uncultured Lamprocystis sp.]|jgi:hypothetical protein|uniref:PcfJ domain-containing protein n=1 Tax=uncultured Lamprocystis sp. TaxID=543132 RepID=UPI0025F5A518|nr:PcfJ domain-containing protein [uncultured Lamprocystis sp.]